MRFLLTILISIFIFIFLPFRVDALPSARTDIQIAEGLYLDGKYDEALPLLNKILQKDPNNTQVQILRGDLFMKTKNYRFALQDYSNAVKLNPTLCSARIKKGKAYEKLGEINSAAAEYNSVISEYPMYSDGWLARGELFALKGESAAAIQDFTSALKLNPSNSEASLARGKALLSQNEYMQSIFDFDTVIMTYDSIPLDSKVGDVRAWGFYYRGIAYDYLDKEDMKASVSHGYATKAADSFNSFLKCPQPEDSQKELSFAQHYLYTPSHINDGIKTEVVKVTLIGRDTILVIMRVDNVTDRYVTSVSVEKFDLYLDDDIIGRRNVLFTPADGEEITPGSSGFLQLRIENCYVDFHNWSVTIFAPKINYR